jgi:hypothetical protein
LGFRQSACIPFKNIEESTASGGLLLFAIDPQSEIQLRDIVSLWYNLKSLPHDKMDEDILTVAVHTAVKLFLSKWSERLLPGIGREQWWGGIAWCVAGRRTSLIWSGSGHWIGRPSNEDIRQGFQVYR